MKILECPVNGPRPLQEFLFGGQLRPTPDPESTSDSEWADYIFNRAGEPGVQLEWWYHIASGVWFIAERDTLKDEVIRTLLYQDLNDHE